MANYLLTQTGEEVQVILNQAPETEAGLQQEVTNREQAITAEQQAREQAIAAEATAREQAIAAEATAREQAVSAEATVRADADDALDTKIDAETTRAVAAEGTLTDAINKEVTDRTAAVAAEATARQQADTTLQQAISTEAQARSAADTEILGNLQTEARTRLNADTDLQEHIDDEEERAKAAEATLQANIDTLGQSGGAAVAAERERAEAAEGMLDAKIDAETDRAEAAEGTLNAAIAQEVTDRTAAVSAEATARADADAALQTAINGKQATIADLADIRSGAAAGATAYQKPATGIPATDMSSDVQTSLDKADTALQEHQSLDDYYTKSEVDNLITTPDQEYVSVTATAQTTAVTDLLPSTGAADTLYRVGNWDGTQYDPTMYALFAWNGTTYVCLAVRSFVGEVYDVSVNHPDGQGNPTPYADLTAALGTDGANIPVDIRRGGMSIKFIQGTVQSSDNKYVQYMYVGTSTAVADFTDVANWEKINLEEKVDNNESIIDSITEKVSVDSAVVLSVEYYTTNVTNLIYFIRFPRRLKKINAIDFVVESANQTVDFYKVHLNGSGNVDSYSLIKSTVSSKGGINRVILDNDIELVENEYIGISNSFGYTSPSNSSLYNKYYTINAGTTSAWKKQDIGYSLLYIGEYEIDIDEINESIGSIETSISGLTSEISDISEEVSDIEIRVDENLSNYENTNLNGSGGTEISQEGMCYFRKSTKKFSKFNILRYYAVKGIQSFYKVTYTEGSNTCSYELLTTVTTVQSENRKIKTIKFDNDISLESNQYIGISGDVVFASDDNGAIKDMTLSSHGVNPSDSWRKRTFYFELGFVAAIDKSIFEIEERIEGEITEIETEVAEIKLTPRQKFGSVVLYDTGKLLSSNPDIVGTQTFDSYGLIVGSESLVLDRYYSLADRTLRCVCKFNANAIAWFGCMAGNSWNTIFRVDPTRKVVSFGADAISAVTCSILNATDEFIVEISIFYQTYTLNIINCYNGESFTHQWVYSGSGGTGDGIVSPASPYYGKFWDKYFVRASEGSFKVRQIIVESTKCDLLVYGDSITEPEGYWPHDIFNESWTKLLIDKMGGRAMTSGRGATSIDSILKYSGGVIDVGTSRIANELPFIKPKYVMVTIGTNGGNTNSKLTALMEYIIAQGATPILNHIPTNQQGTAGGYDFAAENALIDTVRNAFTPVIKGADFDIATSIVHDGQDCDITDFWLEGTLDSPSAIYHHPNVKGSMLMFCQLLKDVPEIF